MSTTEKKKKKREFPHVILILMSMSFLGMVMTWIIPAGEFDRVVNDLGRAVVVPGSFHYVDPSPQSLWDYLAAMHTSGVQSASIIFFIFMIMVSFNVVQETGAIEAGLAKVALRMRGREKLMIPVVVVSFSMVSTVIAMADECYPFIPLMMAMSLSMGFDSFTGVLAVLLGCSAGFTAGVLCPFTVGLAHGLVDLPAFSGMGMRIILLLAMDAVMIYFVARYAERVKKNPLLSLSYENDKAQREALLAGAEEDRRLTTREKVVLAIFLAGMGFFAYGVVKLNWSFSEMAGLFIAMGFLCGIASGMSLNEWVRSMIRGTEPASRLVLLAGISRAFLILLENGKVLDTILYELMNFAETTLENLPTSIAALGMYVFQCLLSFLIGSSSAHATVAMPLMIPMADVMGITRQTAVLAWQIGDSISNVWLPTGYSVIAMSIAGVPWQKFFKWYIPCIMTQYVVGAIFVIVAVAINFGPY